MQYWFNNKHPLWEVLKLVAYLWLGLHLLSAWQTDTDVWPLEWKRSKGLPSFWLPPPNEEQNNWADLAQDLAEANPPDEFLPPPPPPIESTKQRFWYPFEPETNPPPTPPAQSKYIVLAGDSMTEQIRFIFERYAAFNGHRLLTLTWYSSTSMAWEASNRLQLIIDEYQPDFIFFTLGGNEIQSLNQERPRRWAKQLSQTLDSLNLPFIWIATPAWREQDTLYNQTIKNVVGTDRCYLLPPNIKLERMNDGAHPTREAAEIWGQDFSRWFRQQARYAQNLRWLDPNTSDPNQKQPYTLAERPDLPRRKEIVRVFKPRDNQTYQAKPKTKLPEINQQDTSTQ